MFNSNLNNYNYITSQSCPVQSLWPTWLLWCSLWCHQFILSFAPSAKAVTLATTGTYSGPLLLLAGGNGCAPVSDMTGGMGPDGRKGQVSWAGCWGCCVFYMRTKKKMFGIFAHVIKKFKNHCWDLLHLASWQAQGAQVDWNCHGGFGSPGLAVRWHWWFPVMMLQLGRKCQKFSRKRPAQSLCSRKAASCRSMIIQKTSFIWSILALFVQLFIAASYSPRWMFSRFFRGFIPPSGSWTSTQSRAMFSGVWASGGALCRRHHTTRLKKKNWLGIPIEESHIMLRAW